jgi:diguanylate cyclase (GGDEF)-like protein/PAS domain S-box-containing protein
MPDDRPATDDIDRIYREILENLYEGVFLIDRDKRITYWNKAAEQITGFQAAEVVGMPCSEDLLRHVGEQDADLFPGSTPIAKTLEDGTSRELEAYLYKRDGGKLPVLVRIAPVRNPMGEVVGALELFADNSSTAAILGRIHELERYAMIDPLTALGNRRYTEMTLRARIEEAQRYGLPFGIVFFDLDDFKAVNDRHGHDTGDKVLKMVADALVNRARPFDNFGRWGGEEFIGIFRNVDPSGLETVAERLRLNVRNACLEEAGLEIRVTISAGGTVAMQGDSIDALVRRADRLMYESKRAGKDRVTIG